MNRIGTLAARFEVLVKTKKQAVNDEKSRKEEMRKIEDELLLLMGENGFQNIKTESGMNLHRKTNTFFSIADGVSKEEFFRELASHSCTADLVAPKCGMDSLRARVSEMEVNHEVLPPEIQRMVRITEEDRIGYRS